MGKTVTFRIDPETARILKELVRQENGSKSSAIKRALREHWERSREGHQPSAWEVYAQQTIPRARPHADRARNVSKIMRQILLAKKRKGTF